MIASEEELLSRTLSLVLKPDRNQDESEELEKIFSDTPFWNFLMTNDLGVIGTFGVHFASELKGHLLPLYFHLQHESLKLNLIFEH